MWSVAKLVVAKLGLTTHMGNLVLKVAVPILVEAGKTQLLAAACVFLLPSAGDACCKLRLILQPKLSAPPACSEG